MRVTVQALNGKSICLEMDVNDTILNMKTQLKEMEDVPIDQQRLIFEGQILQNQQSLLTYSITEGSSIDLVRCPAVSVEMPLQVETLMGRKVTLLVNSSDTIEKAMSKLDGIPFDQQRAVFAGKLLENDHTFEDYNIPKDATIHMVLRPS
eukprot:symbB.v1.2.004665.t1/scaffold230.1/size260421/2